MKPEFINYLEENYYVDFSFSDRDKYMLDENGNIIELHLGWKTPNPIGPDPKNISDLSIFIPLNPFLKALHIRGCWNIEDMSPIENFIHLRELSLTNTTDEIKKITGLENLTELETLDLSGNRIEKIEGLENLTKLKLLDLSNNGFLSEEGFEIVEGLDSLVKLETLYLHGNRIKEINSLHKLTNLKNLTISTLLTEFPDLRQLKLLERIKVEGKFNRIQNLSDLKNLHSVWIESDKEIENIETLLNNKNLINIMVNYEKVRGDVSGIYTKWYDR